MSDDERDIDIESDDDLDEDGRTQSRSVSSSQYSSQAEKRAHHNALERKRRDHIKDSFTALRDAVPSLQGEKVASRAQILKKAADYITYMKRKNSGHQQDNEDLKRQNNHLDIQIKNLEQQLAASERDGELIGYGPEDTSESEMSDMDDDDANVDIVSTPSQSSGYRKQNGTAGGSKKAKTTYSARVTYQ